jgi:hypothetical protein
MPDCHHITINQIQLAHRTFLENEPRDLFYRAAIYLVEKAINMEGTLSLAEAVSVLLQTWNRSFYRYHPFTNEHFDKIEELLTQHQVEILQYRPRFISSLSEIERNNIPRLFESFEKVLGPIGAAKTLHLLAPRFFSIWDRTIAVAYGLPLTAMGTNGDKYFSFMLCQKEQSESIVNEIEAISTIKVIDEYNYCHFTKGWI